MSPVPGLSLAYHLTDTIATTAREVDFNAAIPNKSPMLPWRFGWRLSSRLLRVQKCLKYLVALQNLYLSTFFR